MNSSNDVQYYQQKTHKLQREVADIDNEKRDIQLKLNKMEAQKQRLEQVFKSTMKGGNMDLIDEVQMLVRRIEFLEDQSDKRAKNSYLETQEPFQREIGMLKQKLV